jgi:hypothetical protein
VGSRQYEVAGATSVRVLFGAVETTPSGGGEFTVTALPEATEGLFELLFDGGGMPVRGIGQLRERVCACARRSSACISPRTLALVFAWLLAVGGTVYSIAYSSTALRLNRSEDLPGWLDFNGFRRNDGMWIAALCFLVPLLVVQMVAGLYGVVCRVERFRDGWPMGHVMVYGAVLASVITFIVVLIVVPREWNLASAVSGAAEVNETLTEAGRSGLGDYDQFDVTVRSLRVQRWTLVGVIVAAVTFAVALLPCFYAPDSGEHEEAVKRLEMAWGFAMLISICTAVFEIASASLMRGLGDPVDFDVAGENFTLPEWEWHEDLWQCMLALAIVTLAVLIAVCCVYFTCPPRLSVLWFIGVLALVMTTAGVVVSATRTNVAYAFSDVAEVLRQRDPKLCSDTDPELCKVWGSAVREGDQRIYAVRGLVPIAAVLNGLVIEVVLVFFLPFLLTVEWCSGGCGDARVGDE